MLMGLMQFSNGAIGMVVLAFELLRLYQLLVYESKLGAGYLIPLSPHFNGRQPIVTYI